MSLLVESRVGGVEELCSTTSTPAVGGGGEDVNDIEVVADENAAVVEPPVDERCEDKEDAEKQQQKKVMDDHLQKDAELEDYLESLKPKPKRKSIKEILMSLPSYKELAAMKPKLGGGAGNGKKEDVIFFDDDSKNRKRTRGEVKRQQQIEALKDRFVRHCITAPPKTGKGEHVKLKINKKEEDSQGIEHLVENEVDYVRNPLHDGEEAVNFLTPNQQIPSPKALAPGASRRRLQDTLLEQIRARKLKEHEERVKEFNMNEDEKDENEVEEMSDDEEIVEDEELENESDEENENPGDDDNIDEDDDDESKHEDSEDSDSSEEEEEDDDTQIDACTDSKDADLASIGGSEDSLPSAQVACDKIPPITPVKEASDDTQKSMDFGGDFTPKVTTAVLNQEFKRTPSDLWIPAKSNLSGRQVNDLSPIIPRISKPSTQENKQTNSDSMLPESLANVISDPKPHFDDLVELCSGRFVTQANVDAAESQEEDEFDGFDFGDDDGACDGNGVTGKTEEIAKTPKADTSITAVDGITPKLAEKVPKTRLLMQFDEQAGKTSQENQTIESQNNQEDDTEDIIGIGMKKRKQKRLQFSDDEDDDDGPNDTLNSSRSDDAVLESEDETEKIMEEIVPEKPKGLFYDKHGRLKRKFVEDEAELSGSEEGSDDEDERGLNHYEMEEGDDEELDEDEVKNQVERAHLKQLLDDDDRNVRMLQNRYLENGEFHSDKQREKKFSWKFNLDDLNDDANFGDSDDDQVEENPEDDSKKQAWIEKRKWMSENSHLLEAGEEESQSLLSNSRFLKIGKNTIKRLESFVDTSTSESSNVVFKETSIQRKSIYEEIIKAKSAAKKKESALTSCSEGMTSTSDTNDADQSNKSMSQPLFGEMSWTKSTVGSKKGSFLSRGGMMLAKLADSSKPGDAVSNIKNNSRNFVFQHITPPNPEKTDGTTSRVKRAPAKAGKQAPAKKLKIDRSFSNLDEASKEASIFKWL